MEYSQLRLDETAIREEFFLSDAVTISGGHVNTFLIGGELKAASGDGRDGIAFYGVGGIDFTRDRVATRHRGFVGYRAR